MSYIARRVLLTETAPYRRAWRLLMTRSHPVLSAEEAEAVRRFEVFERWASRAMGEIGDGTSGGYGVPVFLDPSIIATAQGSGNPFLTIAAVKDVNTNIWKGVSSAGVSWSFDTEAAAVSDDSPTLGQPSVTVHTARGFLPFSIEVGQDYQGFAAEIATLLAEGYDELLIDKFTRGSGSGEPYGILTVLSATAGSRVKLTTAGAIGSPDPYEVWKSVPQRFRRNASWLMSVDVNNAIRKLGTADALHAQTSTLVDGWVDRLFNRAVYESPYMPDTTDSTAATSGLAVVGDFRNYIIARRAGLNTELVPLLFDTTTGRPTGQRGIFAWARIGAAVANGGAFRLLVNS